MYASVLIEYSNKAVDKEFSYIIPEHLKDVIKVGMKVKVPFNNKIINGFVVDIFDNYNDIYELKTIFDVENKEFILDDEMMELGKYLQEKTLCSKIVAYQTMLPSSLKIKEQNTNYEKYDYYVELTSDEDLINEYIAKHVRALVQLDIINTLKKRGRVLKKEFNTAMVKKLVDAGIVKIEKEQIYRINASNNKEIVVPELTDEQKNALDSINLDNHDVYLLHGVTGSGKTEVYMRLIKSVIDSGKTAIFLVPEISLTAQMISRFYERFGNTVAVFHSGLSIGEKYDEYLKINRGEVKIVVGTRSAIFTPIKNIGVIILDEEHSTTFKQDTNPRYNAIDMAIFRGEYNNCPVVLGSATPTLESMARARKGVYKLLVLKNRIGDAKLPLIHLIDMQKEMRKRKEFISSLLEEKIKDRLAKEEQVILLLNRRGYSTTISCSSCGYTYKCPNCDITLTYHKTSNNLRCHYCGYTIFKDKVCPECKEDGLNYLGLGTEKLEDQIKKLFPSARIVRMDVDTTSRKGMHEAIINDFQEHKYDILLGTQMISKGLDFPLVTLVGVINADASLTIPDFRSGERTFELLSQVSGRAGRSYINGEVILQTFNVDNNYLNFVKENDYESFYQYEMNFRKLLKYSPYYYLVSILITSREYELASKEATNAFNYLKKHIDKTSFIFGPTTAAMFRVNNIYRFQIMIKYRNDNNLFNALKYLDEVYGVNAKVNFEIDINPSKM